MPGKNNGDPPEKTGEKKDVPEKAKSDREQKNVDRPSPSPSPKGDS